MRVSFFHLQIITTLLAVSRILLIAGGAIGYVAYDCIQYFEPKTARPLVDNLGIPEAVFMLCDTIIIFDHIFQSVKIVSHVFAPSSQQSHPSASDLSFTYQTAVSKARRIAKLLLAPGLVPNVPQAPIPPLEERAQPVSNVGKEGYEGFVRDLKEHIVAGDIIQAVPSQRLSKPTQLHPFNAYRQLRQVNPSPYMFYLDCGEVQLVGASPETLCKVEESKVYNHAIAGTVKRGKTKEGKPPSSPVRCILLIADALYSIEDDKLGAELLASSKDRAEHIMLVDLARNDVNRVCQPLTVKVDELMTLQKFSHVIHLTSQVTGQLRPEKTR